MRHAPRYVPTTDFPKKRVKRRVTLGGRRIVRRADAAVMAEAMLDAEVRVAHRR
jgi:hypothetical protein